MNKLVVALWRIEDGKEPEPMFATADEEMCDRVAFLAADHIRTKLPAPDEDCAADAARPDNK